MPIHMPDRVGKSYRPANGTEGDIFMGAYCERCVHDDEENRRLCDIIALTMSHDDDEPDYPKEWVFGEDGYPTCTKFEKSDNS